MNTIDLPGSFDSFFNGAGVAQGQTEGSPVLEALYSSYMEAPRVKCGRGCIVRLTVPEGLLGWEFLDTLATYAEACITANGDTIAAGTRYEDASTVQSARNETLAARKVLGRIDKLLDTVYDI